eukprot:354718-Chlamydomonas_euryale.AAC.3
MGADARGRVAASEPACVTRFRMAASDPACVTRFRMAASECMHEAVRRRTPELPQLHGRSAALQHAVLEVDHFKRTVLGQRLERAGVHVHCIEAEVTQVRQRLCGGQRNRPAGGGETAEAQLAKSEKRKFGTTPGAPQQSSSAESSGKESNWRLGPLKPAGLLLLTTMHVERTQDEATAWRCLQVWRNARRSPNPKHDQIDATTSEGRL